MTHRVNTLVQSIADLVDMRAALCVPSYQRPYVWPSDDAVTLLDNIDVSMRDDSQSIYYIGTVLTSTTKTTGSAAAISYELIDGQQRMTTMMLIALAFCRRVEDNALARVNVLGTETRLRFAVRDRVQQLLGHWAGLEGYYSPGEKAIANDAYLTQMHATLVALDQAIARIAMRPEPRLQELSTYLFNRVRWVNNVLPASMDLNRIFATANTAGVQLEQTDMLKARLMNGIVSEKAQYEAIWQACESMDNYFERNVRVVFPNAPWSSVSYDDLRQYSPERFRAAQGTQELHAGLSITQLAERASAAEPDGKPASVRKLDDDRDVYCTPIISFALLLMHTYRIFRFREAAPGRQDVIVRLNETRLGECFSEFVNEADEFLIKRFIECLWQVRYQFDRWVVKWVTDAGDDERQLRLTRVSASGGRLSRAVVDTSNLSQLESVRNFTGERSAQYWLTPFLGQLIDAPLPSLAQVEDLLEKIDNNLSLTTRTQKEASFALLGGDAGELEPVHNKLAYLASSAGTGFEHYWFQKLDYVLWREQARLTCFAPDKLKAYRIASRNSVEHVHPQNEQHGNQLAPDLLDAFGNLVLLSPGENSSYSNKPVGVKRAEFFAKPRYESLKQACMFASDQPWGKDQIDAHQEAMLGLLEQHYLRVGQ